MLDSHVDKSVFTTPVPRVVNRAAGIAEWPMYMNDQCGDCAEAAAGHAVQVETGDQIVPADADILALAETQGLNPADPAAFGGTVLQDLLTWWAANPWCQTKLSMFAELKAFSSDYLRACLYYFGVVYVGVNMTQGCMAQFSRGEPWSVIPGDQSEGGHCVLLVSVSEGLDELTWVTWGRTQRSDQAWWRKYATEAWVPVFPHALANPPPGVNAAQLQAAYQELTG
jgi:hypothetical protein